MNNQKIKVMSNHKIEFFRSESWDEYYSIMIDGKKYGQILLNHTNGEEVVSTCVFIQGVDDTLHTIDIRNEVKNVRTFFRIVKSFVYLCLNNGAIDLSNPEVDL